MSDNPGMKYLPILAISLGASLAPAIASADDNKPDDNKPMEEVVVVGEAKTFSAVDTTASMQDQQNSITSVLESVDNLPGVNVTEGDTFGFDDWSTTINLRGYQTNLSEQQVGITIDGFPNGDSNYGGGTKANRYIDSMNAGGVEVNQGIADIASRSTEALGGTLNFRTNDPIEDARMRIQASIGDFNSRRYAGRYDTGRVLNNSTIAWISVAHNGATDWMENSSQNTRDNAAAKFITTFGKYTLTGYGVYDDIQEDNYQRITLSEFEQDPHWDRLIGTWTGVPYVDQLYRRAWSTLRTNSFGYLKLDADFSDNFNATFSAYHHHMDGRGDWIPPYLQDVVNDAGGPETELTPTTTNGGAGLGIITFVDPNGVALSPDPNCISSITFPYGGASSAFDPACFPRNSVPVQSYRHTHYGRERFGGMADVRYRMMIGDFENAIRAGLWMENSKRFEWRDWHKLIDARVGIAYDETPYWIQYNRTFKRDTFNWYLQDKLTIDTLSFSLGARQFKVDNTEKDNFGVSPDQSLDTHTKTMWSGGATWDTPVDGLEAFLGYAQNVKPLTDGILEQVGTSTDNIEAETADNIEAGIRYVGPVNLSAVYFKNKFKNRLEFFGPQVAGNIPNYSIGLSGRYDNVGGIESKGLELAATYNITDEWSVYGSYSKIDATYVGTGLGAAADAALGLTPGNTVVATPDNMYVVSFDWTRDAYSAGISTKYVGDRFIDRSNTQVAKAYRTSDVYMKVQGDAPGDAFKSYELSLVVNNVFNKSYLGGISGFGAWIGAPRTAVFTMTLDF